MKNASLFWIAFGFAFSAFGQVGSTRMVSGVVTMEGSRTKLSDVVVSVKGTSFGTYSDANGQYKVKLSASEHQLVFSATGYIPQEVSVNSQPIVNVSLKPDPQTLSEIKVAAYPVPEYPRRLRKTTRKRQRQTTTHSQTDSSSIDK